LEVQKYIQVMVVNRCVDPLSKLGATRWVERTCFKRMKGYVDLALDVNHFYRSMDYLLRAKEQIEWALFEQLRNLFSINVKLTFYDITSSYFYTENCPIGANGYSRDSRPDLGVQPVLLASNPLIFRPASLGMNALLAEICCVFRVWCRRFALPAQVWRKKA
jgi:hypothetical protein